MAIQLKDLGLLVLGLSPETVFVTAADKHAFAIGDFSLKCLATAALSLRAQDPGVLVEVAKLAVTGGL